ncbi:membrane protein insertase YidC [Bifidobacterium vespertilionis]|uniref:membrane protein insertase YidC n=1 Tax=Bifidobacterium vespertilionis TaxID=2562524 RepID=UPI001BDBCDC1|nr:membrane protein insertase YidC [Bifidobacterium vespertilionis]MBT1178930.1 membrane protein insertase YidC [Bifidobacterium vespertilionis]
MYDSQHFTLDSGFFGFIYTILRPIEWLQTWIMKLFHDLLVLIGFQDGPGIAWVLSIVFLVLVVHAIILPVWWHSMKSMRKTQAIQPELMKIQRKYKGKNDPASREAMSRETMKLYQDNGANPMGSCGIAIVQGPAFMSVWYTLSAVSYIASGVREPLGAFTKEVAEDFANSMAFGVTLSQRFAESDLNGKIVMGIFIALMCLSLFFLQFNNMRKNLPKASMQGSMYTMQKAMAFGFPVMYIFSGVLFPFAVLVYWITNNVCNLIRSQYQMYAIPTPGSPAAEEKEIRDHKRENARRAKAGEPSLEEEALEKAKEEAAQRAESGFQRQQPSRRKKRK